MSFTTDDSGSYYYDMYFHQQSLFAAVLTEITPQYSVLVTGGFEDTRYRENDRHQSRQSGTHRQWHLSHRPAWWVGPRRSWASGQRLTLTGSTVLNGRTIIDQPPGTGAHSLHAKGQIIQTFKATDNFSIVNNTFYDYLDRYNQTMDYYADTAKGSYTFENKTDFKIKFATGFVSNDVDAGFTYRYAHVLDIQNFVNEPVSIFDLSQSPNTWIFPASLQAAGGALPYNAAFNHPQWGTSGTFSGAPGPGWIFCRRIPERYRRFESAGTPLFSSNIGCSSRRSGACSTACAATWYKLNYSDPSRGPELRRAPWPAHLAPKGVDRLVRSV